MRIYVDLNCFNRPFDDQRQDRIREETEAIFDILTRIVEGKDTMVWSSVLSYENARHPLADRLEEIAGWRRRADRDVPFTQEVRERARSLHRRGSRQ